jgi:hypothetical protein
MGIWARLTDTNVELSLPIYQLLAYIVGSLKHVLILFHNKTDDPVEP